MKRTYTIQFVYNGVPHTYIDRTYDTYKVSMDLKNVALMLVEAVIKAGDLYVEGEVAHEIRLFGKDQELLWASED
jgi:hypothetical protein